MFYPMLTYCLVWSHLFFEQYSGIVLQPEAVFQARFMKLFKNNLVLSHKMSSLWIVYFIHPTSKSKVELKSPMSFFHQCAYCNSCVQSKVAHYEHLFLMRVGRCHNSKCLKASQIPVSVPKVAVKNVNQSIKENWGSKSMNSYEFCTSQGRQSQTLLKGWVALCPLLKQTPKPKKKIH